MLHEKKKKKIDITSNIRNIILLFYFVIIRQIRSSNSYIQTHLHSKMLHSNNFFQIKLDDVTDETHKP